MLQTMAKTRQGVSSMACWLYILLWITGVFGNYVIEVKIKSYNNPTNKCATCFRTRFDAIGCCDKFLETSTCNGELRCDNQFTYCLRPLNTSPDTRGCQGYTNTQTSQVNTDGEEIPFSQSTVLGLHNPFRLPGLTNSWEGAQFYVEVYDIDPITNNEFVDSFTENIARNFQVMAQLVRSNQQSTYTWARFSFSVLLLCAENYYGERCEKFDCTSSQVNCSGRGNCMDGVGAYTCQCEPGYTGRDCETEIDEGQNSAPLAGGIAGGVVGALIAVILIVLLVTLIVILVLKREKGRLKDTQRQRGEDVGSRAVLEAKPKDMDFSMNSNIGYGVVPEATLNRQQNMSTEQSTEDMYDYVDPNV